MKILFTAEFITYIREHSDLWIGYWVSLFGGTGGVTLMAVNPVWDFLGILGGLTLTICSIILSIMLTIKAWYGMKLVKEELRKKELDNKLKQQEVDKNNERIK